MPLEIDIDQVRAAPAPKKSRVFGHVMGIATICIAVIALFIHPGFLIFGIVTGFFAIGGYVGFSNGQNGQKQAHDLNLGTAGFGPQSYMKNTHEVDFDFHSRIGD